MPALLACAVTAQFTPCGPGLLRFYDQFETIDLPASHSVRVTGDCQYSGFWPRPSRDWQKVTNCPTGHRTWLMIPSTRTNVALLQRLFYGQVPLHASQLHAACTPLKNIDCNLTHSHSLEGRKGNSLAPTRCVPIVIVPSNPILRKKATISIRLA